MSIIIGGFVLWLIGLFCVWCLMWIGRDADERARRTHRMNGKEAA